MARKAAVSSQMVQSALKLETTIAVTSPTSTARDRDGIAASSLNLNFHRGRCIQSPRNETEVISGFSEPFCYRGSKTYKNQPNRHYVKCQIT
jgi:hypothetical protein